MTQVIASAARGQVTFWWSISNQTSINMSKTTPRLVVFRGAVYQRVAQGDEPHDVVSRAKIKEEVVLVLRDLSQMISTPVKSITAQLAKPAPVARMMRQHISELVHSSRLMYKLLQDLETLQRSTKPYIEDLSVFVSPSTKFFIRNELAIQRGQTPGVEVRPDDPEV